MPKKYLNVNEVAKLIGVTPLTVRNWDKRGKLEAYRNPVNNYRMYKIEDVEGLLKIIEASKGRKYEPPAPKITTKKLMIEEL